MILMNCCPKIRAALEGIWGCGFWGLFHWNWPKCMHIKGLDFVISMIMQRWAVGVCFRVWIMLMCLSKLCLMTWCVWVVFWVAGAMLCVWTCDTTCNSRSGELGSPRRDMQGCVLSICSWLSLRRKILGFGRGFISLRRVRLA